MDFYLTTSASAFPCFQINWLQNNAESFQIYIVNAFSYNIIRRSFCHNLPKRDFFFANEKVKMTIQPTESSINHNQVFVFLLNYYVLTSILFKFCAKFASVGIVQNTLTLPF